MSAKAEAEARNALIAEVGVLETLYAKLNGADRHTLVRQQGVVVQAARQVVAEWRANESKGRYGL